MEYKINDKELKANIFISFVNKVWKGQYDIEKTEVALSKTINITAYDGGILVGCLRILTDGYFFGTITELLVLPEYKNMVLEVNFSIWQKKLLQLCCILVHSQELNYFMKKMGVKKVYSRIL